MGCNYFIRYNNCKCCKRYDELHIGKSSFGWDFLFHETSTIKTYKDWVVLLSQPDTLIVDEYGEEISFNKFIDKVMSKIGLQQGRNPRISSDGYRFMEGEFS